MIQELQAPQLQELHFNALYDIGATCWQAPQGVAGAALGWGQSSVQPATRKVQAGRPACYQKGRSAANTARACIARSAKSKLLPSAETGMICVRSMGITSVMYMCISLSALVGDYTNPGSKYTDRQHAFVRQIVSTNRWVKLWNSIR